VGLRPITADLRVVDAAVQAAAGQLRRAAPEAMSSHRTRRWIQAIELGESGDVFWFRQDTLGMHAWPCLGISHWQASALGPRSATGSYRR